MFTISRAELWPGQECAQAGKEDGGKVEMNSVRSDKSFGASVSFISELKGG